METVLDKARQYVTERAKLMVKNGADFVCVTTDLSYMQRHDDEECLTEPTPEVIFEWFKRLFTVDLVSKPLNQKAIEAMQKKGITPSRQPSDLQLKVVIVNSARAVHIALQGDPICIFFCSTVVKGGVVSVDDKNLKVYTCQSDQAFKDRDVYMTLIFEEIRKLYPAFFVEDD